MSFHPSPFFQSGTHAGAARIMAGLKQSELAAKAGLHVNSVKRVEALAQVAHHDHAAHRIREALEAVGVMVEAMPVAVVKLAPSGCPVDA